MPCSGFALWVRVARSSGGKTAAVRSEGLKGDFTYFSFYLSERPIFDNHFSVFKIMFVPLLILVFATLT